MTPDEYLDISAEDYDKLDEEVRLAIDVRVADGSLPTKMSPTDAHALLLAWVEEHEPDLDASQDEVLKQFEEDNKVAAKVLLGLDKLPTVEAEEDDEPE